jgi:hypothetical protein
VDLRLGRVAALTFALLALLGSTAHAAQAPVAPESLPGTPAGFEVSAREALRTADAQPVVDEQTDRYGRLTTAIQVKDDDTAWQVGYKSGDREVAQVIVDRATGDVREAWTGYQVAWPMARGYEGQFGHVLNTPYVWIPLSLIFLLGLVDWRRPLRIVHLDLLVLLGFGISHVFFNRGEIGVSVPLVYPILVYLLARMAWVGFRGGEPLRPSTPVPWLAIAAVVLIAFRITLNVADSGVIDVGYSGTIGADRILHGEPLYGEGEFPDDNRFGDTYGPVNYYAYVPFELVLPWSGEWDELPASHAAAIAFDLATVLGLFAFGVRMLGGRRGWELGTVLAFAWLAYPYTAFALQSSSNDSLIAALLAWSLALFAKPVARGALLALAALAKFGPLALVPLYAAGERGLLERWRTTAPDGRFGELRPLLAFGIVFAAVAALMLAHPAIDPGLGTFWERTLRSQVERDSPFSIWGQEEGLEWLQTAILAGTVVFAAAVAFVPRRRNIAQIAALAAAILLAVEITADHWFYLYIPWFAPLLFVAIALPAGVATRASGYQAGTDIPAKGGAVETDPNEATIEDPNQGGDDAGDDGGETGGGDFGGEETGGESAGESEAPAGP